MTAHTIELTERQRAKLERYREVWGLKSLAEGMRHLIEHRADDSSTGRLMLGLRAPTEARR